MWQSIKRGRRVFVLGLSLTAIVAAFLVILWEVPSASAQSVPPDVLQALQQRIGGGNLSDTTNSSAPPIIQTYQPVGDQPPAPTSVLESIYSKRAGRDLKQMGYGALGTPAAISIVQSGAVQDDYVLGVGDELAFEFRGQENSSFRQTVDRNGLIVLPKLNPISAAGRTLAEFRASLENEVSRSYISTKVFVSLGTIRQVSVLVTGEVQSPGTRIVSGLASPVDAILLSRGVTKRGSLRGVRLIRHGSVRILDLYSILLNIGHAHLEPLQDGDRIYVPPLGATVAIAGGVRRSGIYELSPGRTSVSASDLVRWAGGFVIATSYDLSKVAVEADGSTHLIPVPRTATVRSGEILFLDPSRTENLNGVTLLGAVERGGTRPYSVTASINDLFHGYDELPQEAYAPFAIIVRRDPASNAISVLPFSVIQALNHRGVIKLQRGDSIYVFTRHDISALTRLVTKDVNTPYGAKLNGGSGDAGSISSSPGTALLGASGVTPNTLSGTGIGGIPDSALQDPRLKAALESNSAESSAVAQAQSLIQTDTGAASPATTVSPTETDDQIADRVASQLDVPRDMLLHSISDHLVWVLDKVRVPGVYAAAEGTTLQEMIEAAGGAMAQADLSSIEVTSTEFDRIAGISHTTRTSYATSSPEFASLEIRPLDIIRLRQVYSDRTGETITVAGQVRYPGVFDITRDERLSSILQRAGGLTEVAYPYGAIFTRRSAAITEAAGNERSAKELQSELVSLMTSPQATQPTSVPETSGVAFLSSMIDQVRSAPALGRVSVTADPVVLASRPDLDPILEPGDAIYIPKRPSSVNVSGEVLNPGSFQFQSSYGYKDYIRMAGGPTQASNFGGTFIIFPDGSASPTSDNWLTFGNGGHVPPGSTIVVPRDLSPFDWGIFLKDATQIISQLAVTAASLSVISRTN